jgi:adenine-specific DNA-methyltransferase
MNKQDDHLKKLKQLFLKAFDGDKLNIDKLKQLLGQDTYTENQRYDFSWHNKSEAIQHSKSESEFRLIPSKADSVNFDTTNNIYIEGDNLDALKLLQADNKNKIKMIYIDPPYNTGKGFIYSDKFKHQKLSYLKASNQMDKSGNKHDGFESQGRYHTDWLNMMYPRLMLAKQLLKSDGVIFISISDVELANLRKICDEIFSEQCFLACLIWDKNNSAQSGVFKVYHEYVLVYCKDANKISLAKAMHSDIFEAGAMKKASGRHRLCEFCFPKGTRFDAKHGTIFSGELGKTEKVYIIKGKLESDHGKLKHDVTLKAAFTQVQQMNAYFYGDATDIYDSRGQHIVEFYLNSKGKVRVLKQRKVKSLPTTLKFGSQGPISSRLAALFGTSDSPFDSPKPVGMIADFIRYFVDVKSGDIVMDFFAGSSTTAHSVFDLNAQYDGNVRFILVQYPENLDETVLCATKDSKKTLHTAIDYLDHIDKPHTLTEIGKQRIRLCGQKILLETEKNIDIGFKVLKLKK